MNTIVLQLSDAVADIITIKCSAKFLILFTNAHFVADNASQALASSATANPTFNVEEEVVVIRNGWTPKKKRRKVSIRCCNKDPTYIYIAIFTKDGVVIREEFIAAH